MCRGGILEPYMGTVIPFATKLFMMLSPYKSAQIETSHDNELYVMYKHYASIKAWKGDFHNIVSVTLMGCLNL